MVQVPLLQHSNQVVKGSLLLWVARTSIVEEHVLLVIQRWHGLHKELKTRPRAVLNRVPIHISRLSLAELDA